ncbi:MAG: HK97 family phage prohead protease [Solirubrobacterales bacterium]
MPEERHARPQPGELETRALGEVTTEARRLRGVIPYGIESRDMGGWREIIEPGALERAKLDGLVATVDHSGVPIGRYPGTLEVEDRADGLHWAVEPPVSRADVREAVERGDLRSGSWRMRVERDRWEGDVRHVEAIAELRDVSVVTDPAYETAAVELRHNAERSAESESNMAEQDRSEDRSEHDDDQRAEEPSEERSAPPEEPRRPGNLQVRDRTAGGPRRSLAQEFRSRGFDGASPATVPWREFEARAVTLATGTDVDLLAPAVRPAVPLGADQRYAWPAFPSDPVDEATTSVEVLRQKTRTLPATADVIRDIDATTEKPEVGSELELVTEPLRQVAAKESGIPNVYLAQPAVEPIIDTDLRLAVNEGLDKLVLDEVAAAAFWDPADSANLIAAIRHGVAIVADQGYNPDTLIVDPATDEQLDTMQSEGPEGIFIFGPGQYAGAIYRLNRRVSKSATAPVVVDSQAFGRLHSSAVTLRTFEENAGATNTSLIRMELHSLFVVQRLTAAVRIDES